MKKDIEKCSYCPKMCRFSCAVGEENESLIPSGKMIIAKLYLEDKIELSKDVVDLMYKCAECKQCNTYCNLDIDIPNLIEKIRDDIRMKGKQPENVKKYLENLKESQDVFKDEIYFTNDSDILLFLGCQISKYNQEISDSLRTVFRKLDIKYTTLTNELCCGFPFLSLGNSDFAKESSKKNKEIFENIKTIVTACPSCAFMFKEKYKELGFDLDIRVSHYTEFFANKKLNFKEFNRKVAYHDPCHLGRYLGVYKEPRKILKKIPGLELVELFNNKKDSKCCGSGGGLLLTNQNLSKKILEKRVSEIKNAGADMLITSCPTCKDAFKDHILVKDISEIMAFWLV